MSIAVAAGVVLAATACSSSLDEEKKLNIAAIIENTTPFQAEILEDGVVDYSEYERAILAQRQCVTEAGALVSELEPAPGNQLTFSWEVEAPDEATVDKVNNAAYGCIGEYIDSVALVWSEQNLLTPNEKEKLRPEVISCLQAASLELSTDATESQILEHIGKASNEDTRLAIGACVSKYADFFMVSVTDAK